MDLIADLAFPLPFVVISEMLGIPEGRDRFQLREWSGAVVKTFDPILTREESARRVRRDRQHRRVHRTRRSSGSATNPGDDLLTALIAAEDEGDRLSEEELVEQVMLLYIAGHETTVNLIGNGTLALLRNREQLELLRRPTRRSTRTFVDELLRYDCPVQMSRRITLAPYEIDGRTIETGSIVDDVPRLRRTATPRKWATERRSARPPPRRRARTRVVRRRLPFVPRRAPRPARRPGRDRHARAPIPELELATDTLEWNGRIVLRGLVRAPRHRRR